MKRSIFRGACVEMATPMRADGSLDRERTMETAEELLGAGADALLLASRTGEGASLSPEERLDLTAWCRRAARGRLPILLDVSCSAALALRAKTAGADAAVLSPPPGLSQDELFRALAHAAQEAGLPVLVRGEGKRIGLRTYRRLSALSSVCGVIEDGCDAGRLAGLRAVCGPLAVYADGDLGTAAALALGARGAVSPLANLVPGDAHRMCFSFFRGDAALCQQDQLYWLPLIRALRPGAPAVKEALRLTGHGAGPCRGGKALPPAAAKRLRAALRETGLLLDRFAENVG